MEQEYSNLWAAMRRSVSIDLHTKLFACWFTVLEGVCKYSSDDGDVIHLLLRLLLLAFMYVYTRMVHVY